MKEVVIKNAPYSPASENDRKAKPNYLVGPPTPSDNPPRELPVDHQTTGNIGAGDATYEQLILHYVLRLFQHRLPRLPPHKAKGPHDMSMHYAAPPFVLLDVTHRIRLGYDRSVGHPGDLYRLQLPTRSPCVFLHYKEMKKKSLTQN
ncbi:hypothetical protein C1H46_019168 [Malus baccata]|uniref:Uncharacterized protein n=1 Tax=Malus baccata TaxID=106549 RepID=A0A540M8W7_MALBA|nr:hypothetical protein C1H46_019168 [Malus baccata]